MRQFLVPILLLTAVALSSSNILPISLDELNSEQLPFNSQHDDNTYSNKYQRRNLLDELIFKSTVYSKLPHLRKATQVKYVDADNNNVNDNVYNKIDLYNGEGFRKEQWHNYPRQLDRLHNYFYENHDDDVKWNLDPGNLGNEEFYDKKINIRNSKINYLTNELLNDIERKNTNDAPIVNTDPLYILKLRNIDQDSVMSSECESDNEKVDDEEAIKSDIRPADRMIKVKREDESTHLEKSEENVLEGKSVRKRIFSLWSRLQSLNKGHELHHRRHLHAFYGMSDGDGGGVLTAEPRAILMRPPGSPLRWG